MAGLAALQRGRFSDGARVFTVYASSGEAPDSFQVCADRKAVDIVLVVSGLNTGDLHATWGDGWRTASAEWKQFFKDQAFMAFYNTTRAPLASTTAPASTNTRHPRHTSTGKVRFCEG